MSPPETIASQPVQGEERDSCALIAYVDKQGRSSHATIVKAIDALRKMGHRSGDIDGEGDGCGITTDIPRRLWAKRLEKRGVSPHLVESAVFFVAHLFLAGEARNQAVPLRQRAREFFQARGCEILAEFTDGCQEEELGPRARENAPLFWQLGGIVTAADRTAARQTLFGLQLELERKLPEIHIASLGIDSVVFKMQGLPFQLSRVYPELRDGEMRSVITLGHGRYSTNTLPNVERSQPFSLLAHNGEINTIDRLRDTGRALGLDPLPGASDSQDLNRLLEALVNLHELDIIEAMEMLFPAIDSEVDALPRPLREMYSFYRWYFPCSAQGPAAILCRVGDVCLGGVDALGLRPLWFGESDTTYFLSSEKGVVDIERNLRDPRPLAPGEKIAIGAGRGREARIFDYGTIQQRLLSLFSRFSASSGYLLNPGSGPQGLPRRSSAAPGGWTEPLPVFTPGQQIAFGWRHYDRWIREEVAVHGREVIGSMGHTGPLACLAPETLPNIADFCQENVAVVTNPAIDRERESEHFSTKLVLGSRPSVTPPAARPPLGVRLATPLLLSNRPHATLTQAQRLRELAARFSTTLLEDLLDLLTGDRRDPHLVAVLDTTFDPAKPLADRLEGLAGEACRAVEQGAVVVVLDDSSAFRAGRAYIDPALAVARLREALITAQLRRRASLVSHSGAIRNLHDIMFLLGLGADAICPYLLWQVAAGFGSHGPLQALENTITVLQKGIEKVMSTMGIHELCGYGRSFTAIGLSEGLVSLLGVRGFCSSDRAGLDLERFRVMAGKRFSLAGRTGRELKFHKEPLRNPKIGRILRNAALGRIDAREMASQLGSVAEEMPTAIRHLLRIRREGGNPPLSPEEVDISMGDHAMPLVIAAMSFGSQGEISFRAYAEAAVRADIVCLNGEGGEIPDMLGRFRRNRGQQIASGRFGVFLGLLNSADFLEIKIGQGAKPGEGGHLPGNKVTAMVARARRCKEGITLISPSNHHDIYSIEDLAQIITELKTANPRAKVSVKIPVTGGVGTISVGIAKAGADIINISGYEGGTGAAREHAKRFVGLPAEIGVSEAHRALVEAGLRPRVEIWTDGGMRSGDDVLKMILLGANRVGFGTVALMGIGCISCRRCHLDRCPRGITTQIPTREEAERRGVKGFLPRVLEEEADNLARLFAVLGQEIRVGLAGLGISRLSDAVGRSDLLEQDRLQDLLDVSGLLRQAAAPVLPRRYLKPQIVRKPLDYLTRLIAELAMERFDRGANLVRFNEEGVRSTDRAVGTYLAGAMERAYPGGGRAEKKAFLRLNDSVPGNGLCAFIDPGLEVVVEGGSQDGAGKGAVGGRLGVLRGQNLFGARVDGSTGKSFAYGATGGLFMVQNMADSRACIRLSGAEVIFGGRITAPVRDERGHIALRAHLKGFAFEYMTGGCAVVLGDPGPWICSGMTGGIIYQCLYEEYGFDRTALERRLARGANVKIVGITPEGAAEVRRLLASYIVELKHSFQYQEAREITAISRGTEERFVMIRPKPLRPHSAE